MDRTQLLDDQETAIRTALQGWQANMWTAFPAIVESVDLAAMTLTAQPAIQGVVTNAQDEDSYVNLPLLVDVPICFPNGGGFMLTFPIVKGDEVLIVLASRCIDAWWQLGGTQIPMEARMHDLSDGFAIPGPRSTPRVLAGISSTATQLRDSTGTIFLGITPAGLFQMQNPTVSLNQTLTALQTALAAFMTTLAGFAGGGSPVTQTMLQAPAATAEAALAAVLIQIEALLQ